MTGELKTDSSVCGYQLYQDNWTPVDFFVSEKKEIREIIMQWPLRKVGISTVGHVPRNISTVCSLLVDH